MIMPDNETKANWDLLITLVLMFTCMVTPYRIAFIESDNMNWKITNAVIDSLFLIDIILIFNSATQDEEFNVITNRKQLAKDYISSWFLIDLLAIVPFDYLIQGDGNDFNDIVRITRIGRMYKLVKLTRLLRVLKIVKERSKLFKYVQEFLKIGIGFERLFFFVCSFFILIHIVACVWVMVAQLESEENWMIDGGYDGIPAGR